MAASPIARGAAFPLRTMVVARHNARVIGRSIDWLVRNRETMNFTYALEPLNRDQLCWFVSAATGADIKQVRAWMQELEEDGDLLDQLTRRLLSSPHRGISSKELHWGRRLGWYTLVRATQPDHVVETGTHLGLGSCAIAAALRRNGHGRLTTIDIAPEAGCLIGEPLASVIDRYTGNSIDVLRAVRDVDMFLHDSVHTYDYESRELTAVEPNLRPDAIILSDNSQVTPALSDWAERSGRHYLFFKELPLDHWWPGAGIGVAWRLYVIERHRPQHSRDMPGLDELRRPPRANRLGYTAKHPYSQHTAAPRLLRSKNATPAMARAAARDPISLARTPLDGL